MKFNTIETIPKDGSNVLLKTNDGIVSAWFDDEAFEWVCYDDKFTIQEDDSDIDGWLLLELED